MVTILTLKCTNIANESEYSIGMHSSKHVKVYCARCKPWHMVMCEITFAINLILNPYSVTLQVSYALGQIIPQKYTMTPQLQTYCQEYLQLICSKEKGISTSFDELKSLHRSTNPYHLEEMLQILQRKGYIQLYSGRASATQSGMALNQKLSKNNLRPDK